RPRHRAAHQHQMVLAVDLDNIEVAHRDPAVAVPSRGLVALLGPAATAVAGVRTNRAGGTVVLLDAVAGRQTVETVPLHGARGAAALAGADDVHLRGLLEHLRGRQYVADLQLARLVQAELA